METARQVPLWSREDVVMWVKQIGLESFVKKFEQSQVDGDLLLKLSHKQVQKDIGIENGILLALFERELDKLRCTADYSSMDTEHINEFLMSIGPEYRTYTYAILNAGIKRSSFPALTEDVLRRECGIEKSMHRYHIMMAAKNIDNPLPHLPDNCPERALDVLISFHQGNGAHLASLVKVHLQLRGFSVALENDQSNSIQNAKNFLLVLTPNALDNSNEGKHLLHEKIETASKNNCNITLLLDSQFQWPNIEMLHENMRNISNYKSVVWSIDYQDACIEKLERFLNDGNNDRLVYFPKSDSAPCQK